MNMQALLFLGGLGCRKSRDACKARALLRKAGHAGSRQAVTAGASGPQQALLVLTVGQWQ